MKTWMIIATGSTLLPLAALLAWVWPPLAARWRIFAPVSRLALVALALAGAGFLLARPHDDRFSGLDTMTYGNLARAFLDGRGFHDSDAVLEEVPVSLRENFLLHRGPVGRPTRDRVFQLSDWQATATQPFFLPTLSLAAAGLEPVLAPERFVPLVGALWLALVLAAGFCAGGGWGLAAAAALALGTAWPAWFLRGYYAEGVGAALVGGVLAAAAARPLRGGIAAAAGFALGLAVTYHPTLAVLSGPVALGLMLERNEKKTAAVLAAGMLLGLFPFWVLTRWVCQPYGDWTRWETLRKIVFSAPEHQALALALALVAAISLAALGAGFAPTVRAWIGKADERLSPWVWLALGALPLLLIAVWPGAAGATLRAGAVATGSGIRWPMGLLLAAGTVWMLASRRPLRERFGGTALIWAALLFLFIKGVETPVGLWSQRRFLPVALVGIAWLAAPLGAGLAANAGRGRKWAWPVALLAAVAALWNPVHWPLAYVAVNERGATAWAESVAEQLGTERRVIFDYYSHSIPYAAGLKQRVLGLGEFSGDRWPDVAAWISARIPTEEVWVATSWSPTALEDGWRLDPVFAATGVFPVAKAKAFFPAVRGERIVENVFSRAVPLARGAAAMQDKVLDGSPIGLRGPWGKVRNGATWSRQGSGIVGPIPAPGQTAFFSAECAWTPPATDWTEQIMWVEPPWGGAPLRLAVSAEAGTVQGTLTRPMDDAERPPTGTYALRAERPYDPGAYGLCGYASDLGVPIRRIIIRVEPGAPSVPD